MNLKSVIFFLVIAWLPWGCLNPCGKDVPNTAYYDIQGYSCMTKRMVLDSAQVYTYDLDYTGNDSISFTNLRLYFNALVNYHAFHKKSAGLFQTAMACDIQAPGYKGTSEKWDSVVVVSNRDFDSTHRAGSNVSEYLLFDQEYSVNNPIIPLEEAIKLSPAPSFYLNFLKAPAMEKEHQFTFHLYISNHNQQEHYTVTSALIKFN